MSRNPIPGVIVAAAAIFLMPFVGVNAAASPAQPPPPTAETPTTLAAAVRLVDTEARTIELITGTGHALRLARMRMGPSCRIQVAGVPAGMRDLKPGTLVRVEYGRGAERDVATAIHIVRLQETEGKP